jgi:hypothetical protein
MRVLLSTYGSRGDVEPLVGLTDGATVAARLLADAVGRDRPPVSA